MDIKLAHALSYALTAVSTMTKVHHCELCKRTGHGASTCWMKVAAAEQNNPQGGGQTKKGKKGGKGGKGGKLKGSGKGGKKAW